MSLVAGIRESPVAKRLLWSIFVMESRAKEIQYPRGLRDIGSFMREHVRVFFLSIR